ncbi:MAG: SIMPL domain-containing protein, partial [Candidatus Eremiobacteraeota bacterium]|nr:SIMPL domain-containing protein [Candidatus Eremiobacteraeota bacterium]
MQQGIYGTVQVIVSLDAESHVVNARIQSSPNATLNQAALAATRASIYQTEIRDCTPRAGDFIASFDFGLSDHLTVTAQGTPVAEVGGEASIAKTPDLGYLYVTFIATGTTQEALDESGASILSALHRKLGSLGVPSEAISVFQRPGLINAAAGVRNAPGLLKITIDRLAGVPAIAAAIAATPSTQVQRLSVTVHDRDGAHRDALQAALSNAQARAMTLASRSGKHLGDFIHADLQNDALGLQDVPLTMLPHFDPAAMSIPFVAAIAVSVALTSSDASVAATHHETPTVTVHTWSWSTRPADVVLLYAAVDGGLDGLVK